MIAPVIDLAPGAESVALARTLSEQVRSSVARDPGRRAAFDGLRGSIAVVSDDGGTALTLRFDFGRLVVHTGVVGVPDVTIRGPTSVLGSLGDLPSRSLFALAVGRGLGRAGREAPPALKIYGLLTHPLLVRGLLSVLSRS